MTEKEAIRKKILRIRDALPPKIKGEKDASVRQRLFALREFTEAGVIIFYASFRSEVDTMKILEDSLSGGKRIILPKVDKQKRRLFLCEIEWPAELFPGFMGIPEPVVTEGRVRSIDFADTVVLPGAAFDPRGNRLGYGAGYYDMLLNDRTKTMPLIALAYDEQIIDAVPAEEHDVKVDIIVTDRRLIRAKKYPELRNPAS